VKEVGNEDYILSAVLHADERNKALSEELERDVYHYHLHVVYVPVVEKTEYYRRRKNEPEDAPRKVKAVYQQISHAKKWPMRIPVERDGKTIILNSYSLLQDRFFDGMKAAGFDGFERGEFGSTKEHLDVLNYKIQQEKKRHEKARKQAEKKEAQLEKLDAKIAVKQTKAATLAEIDAMGKPAVFGGVHLSDDEAKRLKALARQTIKTDERIAKSKHDTSAVKKRLDEVQRQLRDAQAEVNHWHREYTSLWDEVKDFIGAIRKFPARLKDFIAELFRPEREAGQRREAETQARHELQRHQKISHGIGGR
jgi:hypothetical protein